jgi:hypothetical protein
MPDDRLCETCSGYFKFSGEKVIKQILEDKRDVLRSVERAAGLLVHNREMEVLVRDMERYETQINTEPNGKPICPWPIEVPFELGKSVGSIDLPFRELSDFETRTNECRLCYQVTAIADYYLQDKAKPNYAKPTLHLDRFSKPSRLDFTLLREGGYDNVSFTAYTGLEDELGMYSKSRDLQRPHEKFIMQIKTALPTRISHKVTGRTTRAV